MTTAKPIETLSVDGTYTTREGTPVTVLTVSMRVGDGNNRALVLIRNECSDYVVTYSLKGRIYEDREHPFDLIPGNPWHDFEVDEPVLVRDFEGELWVKRYFAGVFDGRPYVWMNGVTSWTSANKDDRVSYKECRRFVPLKNQNETKDDQSDEDRANP